MSDQEPTIYNGRYELHRQIARGGMADVFLARDQLLDRPVAIKVLFPQFASDPSFVERFRREAQSAANLNHPNIVAVYDWGEERGTYFIVMEYVEGRSLAEILRSEGMLHPDRAADIATDVAAALSFAHRNGVVHRDIKPGNILIAPSGQVKVTDFGIARAFGGGGADSNLTQTGSVMGTATYFSPEQAQGQQVDPRSDLYSLGIVLFEMLASRPPFTGDSAVVIAYKQVQEAPVTPSSINPRVPASIEAITMRLLAKSPADRYPSAEDVRADLRRFREGHAVLAAGVMGAAGVAGAGVAAADPGATSAIPTTHAPAPEATTAVPVTQSRHDVYEQHDEIYDEPSSRIGWFIAGLVVLVVVLVGLLMIFADALGIGGDDNEGAAGVEVPPVIGLTEAEATAELEAEGFTVVPERVENVDVESGRVFDQDPEAGETAPKGSEVVITVSAGAESFPMPDVVGSRDADAIALLTEEYGLVLAEGVPERRHDDEAPAGEVLEQTPAATEPVSAGDTFNLVVSDGPELVPVPDVEGETPSDAGRILTDADFRVFEEREHSESVPEGRVTRTDPPEGEAPKGSEVTIFISDGPPPVETAVVPNVVNQTQATAESQLSARGFNPEPTTLANSATVPAGSIISQSVAPGTELARGSSVGIVVSQGASGGTTTTSPGTTTTTAGD
ncbi:MAG: Stk1 family PASTA domain-containing Ser/Thr kinase [Acidimicrobiia bacterium]|nr:Stk1 family PASTA domain-containing Ser/Thr kinase [Acidimicrobiia bacterium]